MPRAHVTRKSCGDSGFANATRESVRQALLLGALVAINLSAQTGHAQSYQGAKDEPYCGLYSMHAALHSLGLKMDFEELVVPEYLSGDAGSTAADLITIAEKYGAKAQFQQGLTLADLRAAKLPVLLHTSVVVTKSGYHHWVLFLGMDGDKLRIYDPPGAVYKMAAAETLSQWDGIGIVVGHADEAVGAAGLNLELILAVTLVIISGCLALRLPALARRPAVGMLVAACPAALVWHAVVDYGFFANPYARASVATRFETGGLPEVTTEELQRLMKQPSVTVIDASRSISFVNKHLPGAISVPVTVTHGGLRDALDNIPRDNHIIVYCGDHRCQFADKIARQFPPRGYHRVSIYREGLLGWIAQGGEVIRVSPGNSSTEESALNTLAKEQ